MILFRVSVRVEQASQVANPERTLCVVYENFLSIFQIQCDWPKVTLLTYFLTDCVLTALKQFFL